MTEAKAKELIEWMRKAGVAQFQFEGLSVVFHPKAIELPARTQQVPEKQDRSPRNGGLSVNDVCPPYRASTGAPNG